MKKPTTKAGKAAKVAKVMGEYKRGIKQYDCRGKVKK
jgi:hypothetical protein